MQSIYLATCRSAGAASNVFFQFISLSQTNIEPLIRFFPLVYFVRVIAQELKELKCRKCNLQQVNSTVFSYLPNLMELDLGDNDVTIDLLGFLLIYKWHYAAIKFMKFQFLFAVWIFRWWRIQRFAKAHHASFGWKSIKHHQFWSISRAQEFGTFGWVLFFHQSVLSNRRKKETNIFSTNFHFRNETNTICAPASIYCIALFLFRTTTKYIHLDLAHNRLTEIANGALEVLSNLTHLDVSYNKLAKLESANVEPLQKLQSLNISGNIRMDLHEMQPTLQVSFELFWDAVFVIPFFYFASRHSYTFRFVQFPLLRWHALCEWIGVGAIAMHTEFGIFTRICTEVLGSSARQFTGFWANVRESVSFGIVLEYFTNFFDTKLKFQTTKTTAQMLESKLNVVIQIQHFIGLRSLKITEKFASV